MTYRATLTLAGRALLKLAEGTDPDAVFAELGKVLDNGDGGELKVMLVQARAEAALAVIESEGGSQRQAAARLGISQPTLSRQLGRARPPRAAIRGCDCGARSRSLWQHEPTCRLNLFSDDKGR